MVSGMVSTITLGFFALLSCAIILWQWDAARRFPLYKRPPVSTFAPGITILKPLKGIETSTFECLQSWFNQNYTGSIQLLFGVASENDPVCEVVRRLMREHPAANAQLVICDPTLGANAKVSTLIQLEKLAGHDLLIISDADVLAPKDLLTQLAPPFQNPDTGLVNCLYSLANPHTPAMHWEAVAINADFWSQVCQSRILGPMDFALGAVMATTRSWMRKIGGFSALKNHLADDYELGQLIHHQGGKIVLSTVPVECWSSPMTWCEVWHHQLRWAITIRHCKPLPYFFSILSNGTLWPLLWLAAHPSRYSLGTAVVCLCIRIATAANLQQRLTGARPTAAFFWPVLPKDLLQFLLWTFSLFIHRVQWRGNLHHIERGGKITRSIAT
jgi:ceramide glucosyltransferase